jgi:hypothetical protein
MGIIQGVLIVLKIIAKVFDLWVDYDKERREAKRAMIKRIEEEIPNAIKSKDASAINGLISDMGML